MNILVTVIRFYQVTISPDHGLLKPLFPHGVCRYEPTCSEYMIRALQQHSWRGLLMGVRRIGRCHPLARGGYDPVPSLDS